MRTLRIGSARLLRRCGFHTKASIKIRDLFTQDYGMRESYIIAPNDCLVFVGQDV